MAAGSVKGRRVTVLSDFGTRDGYVAAMKGVVAALAPEAHVDDVAHDLAHGDVPAATRALARYWRLYPPGTVHLCVVDPGVGTERRALACEADGRFVVAPDNGVVSPVLDTAEGWRCVQIQHVDAPVQPRSATFHGRDVFAPAAGHLAAGGALDALGPVLDAPVRRTAPAPVREEGEWRGRVVAVDRFGNLLSDLPGDLASPGRPVRIGGHEVPLRRTYGDVGSGEAVALVNSDGMIEVAVRDGSAADRLELGVGASVCLDTADG